MILLENSGSMIILILRWVSTCITSSITLYDSEKMGSWLGAMKNAINIGAVSFSAVKVHFTHSVNSTPHRTPIERLHILMTKIAEELPPPSSGKQRPVLFFDEANRLRSLLCDPDGQAALESLFQFLVMYTKEKKLYQPKHNLQFCN